MEPNPVQARRAELVRKTSENLAEILSTLLEEARLRETTLKSISEETKADLQKVRESFTALDMAIGKLTQLNKDQQAAFLELSTENVQLHRKIQELESQFSQFKTAIGQQMKKLSDDLNGLTDEVTKVPVAPKAGPAPITATPAPAAPVVKQAAKKIGVAGVHAFELNLLKDPRLVHLGRMPEQLNREAVLQCDAIYYLKVHHLWPSLLGNTASPIENLSQIKELSA